MRGEPPRTGLANYQPHPGQAMGHYQAEPMMMGGRPPAEDGESVWKLLDDRLRGRWHWMMLLAFVLGGGLAFLGWRSSEPRYESVGVIRVTPSIPVFMPTRMPETEATNFGMFVNTQVSLIRSRRVLENAMNDHKLAALPWSKRTNALKDLETYLQVRAGRNTELIYVTYECEDPKVAQTVVNAVLNSYNAIYGKAGGNEVGRTLERLREHESEFRRTQRRVNSEIESIHSRYGTSDLIALQTLNLERSDAIRQQVLGAERALTLVQENEGPAAPTLAILEQVDPTLGEVRGRLEAARTTLTIAQKKYRPGTPARVYVEDEFEVARKLFEEEYLRAIDMWEKIQTENPGLLAQGGLQSLPPERLQEEIDGLKTELARLLETGQTLVVDIETLRAKRLEQEDIAVDLEATTNRIQDLKREEENIAGRISIEQEGFRPLGPTTDGRKKRAAMGLVAGFGASFGLFFLVGTIDRRAFGASQLREMAEASALKVLGVLPDLGKGTRDPDANDTASHCVHQIRNQIEAFRDPRPGYVMAVSSPFQGDGKTSIVMTLGWSYAVAGYRVLVIDCDLVGCSLTRQTGLTGRDGIKEVLLGSHPTDHIVPMALENLDVLPVGVSPHMGSERIRVADLEALFEQVRPRYDMIIIDTGPLLGSLESVPVTATADGVVLSVRRGRSRTRLEECVGRLNGVGARCLGMILNYAAKGDCNRYVSETSLPAPRASREDQAIHPGGHPIPVEGPHSNALIVAMERTTSRPVEESVVDAEGAESPAKGKGRGRGRGKGTRRSRKAA